MSVSFKAEQLTVPAIRRSAATASPITYLIAKLLDEMILIPLSPSPAW
jgi:hypothetical protein